MGRYSTTRPAVESQEIKWDERYFEGGRRASISCISLLFAK